MTNYVRAFRYMQALMRQASWKPEKLEELRQKKLRAIIKYAYENSLFYNRWFKDAGITPGEIKTCADLNRLPVIRKDEFIRNSRDFVSREYDVSKLKVRRTSGSTGKPKLLWLTGFEDDLRKAKHLRAQMALGQKPWDKWVTITTPSHFAETTKFQRMFRFFGITALSVFEDVQVQVSKLQQLRPDVLDGFSSSILLAAKEVQKKGITSIKPRLVVSGADLIGPDSRRFVEGVFGVPFYDQYATIEFERIAWQCREKAEYHIDADTLIVQFLDENGEEVAPGEEGEIVCTSLFNHAMPFIRYALDDVGIPSNVGDCGCGRTLPLMKIMDGRKYMLLTLPGGKVLSPLAFSSCVLTFRLYSYIDLYRIIQRRKDLIVFKLKMRESGTDLTLFRQEFLEHVYKKLGFSRQEIAIEVEFVDDIPIDKSGKFRLVTSELGDTL